MSVTLSHLFECHFRDGSVLRQTPEDISQIDPARSAFYDVAQRLEEVAFFGVYSVEDPTQTYVVDLRDGHFEINGRPFRAGDPQVGIPEDAEYRLVYFRQNVVQFDVGYDEIGRRVHYHIGWQVTVNGKNHQQTIAFE